MGKHEGKVAMVERLGRRLWLKRTALASGALLARAAHGAPAELPLATPESTRKLGAPILNPEYGLPSPYEAEVLRKPTDLTPTQYSSWSFTPLQDLRGMVTPNGLFFERHHGGVPDIAPDEHRLVVHGLVKQPLLFTMDDLVRFPAVSRFHFLECSGNGSTEWAAPRGKTVQFTHGLLSCCEWTGVPLATVLEEAGIKPEAKWILAEGAGAAAMTRSIPIARVAVSIDGGKSWREAGLQEPVMKKSLTRFRLPWRWDGAPAILQSRAVDETGYVQPSRQQLVAVRGLNSYYHNNSIQSWQVAPGGEVANVHA